MYDIKTTFVVQTCTSRKCNTDLFLFTNDLGELSVDNSWVEFAAHQQRSFIVLDVAQIGRLWQLDYSRETLTTEDNNLVMELQYSTVSLLLQRGWSSCTVALHQVMVSHRICHKVAV